MMKRFYVVMSLSVMWSCNVLAGNVQVKTAKQGALTEAEIIILLKSALSSYDVDRVANILKAIEDDRRRRQILNHSFMLKPFHVGHFDKYPLKAEGWRALHFAAYAGNDKLVGALLENDAPVDAANDDGATALCLAAGNLHASTMDKLLQFHANPNIGNPLFAVLDGCSFRCPLRPSPCPMSSIVACVHSLLNAHVNMTEKDRNNETILHLIAHWEDLAKIIWPVLVQEFANQKAAKKFMNLRRSWNGNTALHLAASEGNCTLISLLLDAGAKTSIVNDRKQTPYGCALEHKRPEAIQLFEEYQKQSSVHRGAPKVGAYYELSDHDKLD